MPMHDQSRTEWVHAPEAELLRETERGVQLRLKSGREEWFPRSAVTYSPATGFWFIAKWLVEKRRRQVVDTSAMRPRTASITQDLLFMVVAFGLALAIGLGFVQAHCGVLMDLHAQIMGD